MTPEALIEQWRKPVQGGFDDPDYYNGYDAGRESCADDLEAALGERETAGDRELRLCLQDLYALVQGECPSLLDEDSGGCAYLALRIEKALAPVSPSRERPDET